MYYREYGNNSGKPVVFIHGGFTDSASFQKQYELLPEYHCFFVDLPGYGKSPGQGRFSFEAAAREIEELLAVKAPGQQAILVAHSYGGLVVRQLLLKAPEKFEKVIVGSTNLRRTPLFWLYTRIPGCAFLCLQERKRYRREHITYRLVRETQKSAWENFHLLKAGQCKVPALFLYAEYDIGDIKKSMENWKCFAPDSRLCMLEGVGHNYFWDAPRQVNEQIRSLLL